MIGLEIVFLSLLELFSLLLPDFSFCLIEVVRKVSPTRTMKAVAVEKNFHPTWTGVDVLA